VDQLLSDHWKVTVIDNFDPFYDRSVKLFNIQSHLLHPYYRLIEGDIRDKAVVKWLAGERVDVIVHLAAKAGVRPSIADPLGYQDVNVAGTQNLLEVARQARVEHFVFGSSSSVYGVSPRVPWTEGEACLMPISPYASTKLSAEFLGHVYSHLYGIRFLGLRFFTVYGPRQRPDLAIHKFARRILSGESIPVYGDGQTSRDYTHVSDIIRGIKAAMRYNGSSFEILNLGNNATITLSRLIALLERATGKEALIEHLPEQPGDVPQTWADLTKATALLGYRPEIRIEQGLTDFIEWLMGMRAHSAEVSAALVGDSKTVTVATGRK
jgi:UDP-glucuronate 4-epimerase